MLKWRVAKVTVAQTATEIVPARAGRKSLYLWAFSGSTNVVYLKEDNTVTASDLDPLGAGLLINGRFTLETEEAVWGIKHPSGSATRDIWFLETYEE